ncbi:MAG: GPW/gp25 family protein [Parachlamydia sp.]|nr:GPW/gp25 family protein [Parachlamydia sp.]
MGLLDKFKKTSKKRSVKEEVVEHLTDFLNTRRNMGTYPADYGIETFVDLGTDKYIVLKIVADIKNGLEKYEKRIHDVEINSIPSESSFHLAFRISCKIQDFSYAFQISFHSQNKIFQLESPS